MKDWIETKRETKELNGGSETVTTEEPKETGFFTQARKDGLDLAVKAIGAVAIFIPLLLLYLQYRHENIKKTNEELSQLFVNAAIDLETVKHEPSNSKLFITASDNLLYKYPAKIAVYKLDAVDQAYRPIATVFSSYKPVKTFFEMIDNLEKRNGLVYYFSDGDSSKAKKPYHLHFLDMGLTSKLSQVEATLAFFNIFDENNYEELNKEILEVSKNYKSNTELTALYHSDVNAFDDEDNMRTKMIALRLALTGKPDYYFSNYVLPGRGPEPGQKLVAAINNFRKGKDMLQDSLNYYRDRFKSVVLSAIKD
jgi:hypothetical protein